MFVPASDKHFQQFGLYQKNVYDLAKKHVQNFRTAIDIGAHVGYFSIYMAEDFRTVYAFEPVMANVHCWCKNLAGAKNITLFPCAVGSSNTPLYMKQPETINSGSWEVANTGPIAVEQRRIDDFQFRDIDYIKVDIQGYEFEAVLGMINAICLWHPIIQLELSTRLSIQRVGGLMSKLGYAPVEQQKDDVIWKFVNEYSKQYILQIIEGDNNHVGTIDV